MVDIIGLRNLWYGRYDVLKAIVNFCKYRESAFLERRGKEIFSDRPRIISTIEYFKREYDKHKHKEIVGIYTSVGKLMYPINMSKYREQLNGYDFLTDFDDHSKKVNLENPKLDTLKVIAELESFNIPCSPVFTGRGFQLRVFSKNIPETIPIKERDELFNQLALNLKARLKLESLDDSQYRVTQLMRLPLSCAGAYVCMPLSIEQVKAFDRKDYHIRKLLKLPLKFSLETRYVSPETAKANFLKFYNEYK